jgi:hypothetical protein
MRTTLTLDDDVAFGIKKAQHEDPSRSFKQIVNDLLRTGLRSKTAKVSSKRPFKVEPLNLGLREDLNFDNIEELLDQLEGPFRR